MKRFVFFLFALVSITSFAKTNLSDKYIMRLRTDDLLYFILPNEIESLDKNKKLKFDITYATSEQDATINMSIFTKQGLAIDSVIFVSTESVVVDDFKTFYIEQAKQWWCHRISCRLPFAYLKQIYLHEEPYRIMVYSKQQVLTYTFPERTWRREQTWMNELLELITQNLTNKR